MIVTDLSLSKAYAEALSLHHQGQRAAAVALYRKILASHPDHAETLHRLGAAAMQGGKLKDAVRLIERAIRLNDTVHSFHADLGSTLLQLGKNNDAARSCRTALSLNHRDSVAHFSLGRALHRLQKLPEAEASYRAALKIQPGQDQALMNLGNLLQERGAFDDSEACYRKLLRRSPKWAEAVKNFGVILSLQGRLNESISWLRKAVALAPNNADYRTALAQILLSAGQFREGWEHYESRWKTTNFPTKLRDFGRPQWDGSSLNGRTLLVHAEQGYGDTIQFCRFLSRITGPGKVVFEVFEPLLSLMTSLKPAPSVTLTLVPAGRKLPDVDLHCPLMSLPRLFGITMDSIPAETPYLKVDPAKVAYWREKTASLDGFRVGLCWAGGTVTLRNSQRSLAPELLNVLGSIPDLSFVSLQKWSPNQPERKMPALPMSDWTDELKDFSDTAALMESLDLIICADTAVAHLAGALGRPVWLLNRFSSCWRWMLGTLDSPWYPTLRQFRQERLDDWGGVAGEIVNALMVQVR